MAADLDPSTLPELPVREVLDDVRHALDEAGGAVLVAPPGAGKTTLVPLALLDEEWLGGRKILVLEPRRLATRAAARRMAALLAEDDAGGTVGYRIRMDTRISAGTRIEVVTEGVLTRMLQSDPTLAGYGAVLFDELHERSIHADLGMALALQARELFREDLRLMAMSATLDPGPVAELLGGVPEVSSEGRQYPVDTHFRDRPVEGWIEPPVVATILTALDEEPGDVLVFLPGAGEIRRTADRLAEAKLPGDVTVFPLFGKLSRKEQDRAIAPSPPGCRKVVLATSIAETSLTIEGVRVVVDSGQMRVPRFDPATGMTRLETVRVTRDSADQRRGRAGRLAPGACYRLWTEGEDRGLVPRRTPEILEADLAPLALELALWGAEPHELAWLDAPPDAALGQARELLGALDAVDHEGSITEHGKEMAALSLHPRLAHMVVRGRELGLGALACDVAALLQGRDVLRAEGRLPDADLRLRVEALVDARSGGRARVATVRGQRVDRGGLARVLREGRQLRRSLGLPSRRGESGYDQAAVAETGLVTALAYPDRIGRRREGGRGRFLLRSGRGARFTEVQPLADSDWLVAAELEGRGRDARIFRAAPLTLDEIEEHFGHQIEEVEVVEWDPAAERVRAHRRRVLGALVLQEAPLGDPDPHRVAEALLEGIREAGIEALPWSKETRQLRERLHFLHTLNPGDWPDASLEQLEAEMGEWLLPFLSGLRSRADLRKVDLSEALLNRVDWNRRSRLDALAPTHLEVPSGSRIPIDYSRPEAPALAVRLQEVFGLTETPRLAGGKVPVTMKLLSPAQRPVQVTTDLASFWKDAYFEVKKEMKGRYPKHYWPEDPLEAEPTRRTKPRG